MVKILGTLGAFVGSSIGWWAGAHVSMFVAFVVSTVGTGFGIYYGRQIALKLEG